MSEALYDPKDYTVGTIACRGEAPATDPAPDWLVDLIAREQRRMSATTQSVADAVWEAVIERF